jgi:D,D-heptose 1,7-bisphosphate phosphatase
MKAVIIAGGKGTRLAEFTRVTPKSLLPVACRPVLEHQIELLKGSNITEIILATGHLARNISEQFADGRQYGVNIEYLEEDKPLGTAGALMKLKDRLRERFLLIYGDLILDLHIGRLTRFHVDHSALCTLVVHPNSHPHDSDVVVIDRSNVIVNVLEKNKSRNFHYNNLVNAGVFVCEPGLMDFVGEAAPQDLEKDVIRAAMKTGRVYAYRTTEYIRDMGTAGRYAQVQADMMKGIPAKRNLRRRQKAVFLYRDGPINKSVGLVYRPGQLTLAENSIQAIRMLNESEYLCIVIADQSVVVRGLCTAAEMEQIDRCLETLLAEGGGYIDALYYCPNHPDKGFSGENPDYKDDCKFRKPGTLLFEIAATTYKIDLSTSYMVGDATVDIQAGKNAGMRTILLSVDDEGVRDGECDVEADLHADSLYGAVNIILTETRDEMSENGQHKDTASRSGIAEKERGKSDSDAAGCDGLSARTETVYRRDGHAPGIAAIADRLIAVNKRCGSYLCVRK